MAVRGRKVGSMHSDLVRERIRTKAIVNRLTNHVMGRIELSTTQVQAGLGLLKKTIPDLQAIEHSGEVAQPVLQVSAEPLSESEWAETYGSGSRPN